MMAKILGPRSRTWKVLKKLLKISTKSIPNVPILLTIDYRLSVSSSPRSTALEGGYCHDFPITCSCFLSVSFSSPDSGLFYAVSYVIRCRDA